MVPRYLTLEEQYKFLKTLAKQYEHVQLKVAIAQIENALAQTSMMKKKLHLINF